MSSIQPHQDVLWDTVGHSKGRMSPSAHLAVCVFPLQSYENVIFADTPEKRLTSHQELQCSLHKKAHEGNTLLMIILFFRMCYQRMN